MKMRIELVFGIVSLMILPSFVSAQEVVDSVEVDPYEDMIIETYYTDDGGTANDTIYLNKSDEDKFNEFKKDLKEYDWVDICYNPKYAVVTKDGKKGLYDMVEHRPLCLHFLFLLQETLGIDLKGLHKVHHVKILLFPHQYCLLYT